MALSLRNRRDTTVTRVPQIERVHLPFWLFLSVEGLPLHFRLPSGLGVGALGF